MTAVKLSTVKKSAVFLLATVVSSMLLGAATTQTAFAGGSYNGTSGSVDCETSGSVAGKGSITIDRNVVTSGSSCEGLAVIPEGVTSIGTYAFYNAQSLVNVTLPSTLTSIDNYAFERTTSLSCISIPASVTSIGIAAFYNTRSLASIIFENGSQLTTIGKSAFASSGEVDLTTTALTSIIIPAGVTSIGDNAFSSGLASLYFLGNAPTVTASTFNLVAAGAKAYVLGAATGFGAEDTWHGLTVARIFTYTVTYNYNSATGGNLQATGSFTSFGIAITLPTPTRSGYTFVGWFSDAALTSKIGDAGSSYSPTGPTVLLDAYAKWTENLVKANASRKPTISGKAKVSKVLTAQKGTWTGTPTPTIGYQWYACSTRVTVAKSVVPKTCVKISRATKPTLTLAKSQAGRFIALAVTGRSAGTNATMWLSKSTAKVK